MKKVSKKYAAALTKIDSEKLYSLEEAVKLVKETSVTKFDASVDIAFSLNVNPTLADQLIRGTITLPHGNGKTKKVLVVTNTKLEEAKESGAELGKMGRVLGPKGLMPNPKTGTVTMDVKNAVAEIKRGKIAYRVDRDGNLCLGIGRVSFSDQDLLDNLVAITDQIAKARPSTVKGTYILNCALSTTMGPAVHITFAGRN